MAYTDKIPAKHYDYGGSGLYNVEHPDIGGEAVGDGTTDSRTALALADALGGAVLRPSRTYRINSNITLSSAFDPLSGAIKPASGVTVTINKLLRTPGPNVHWIDTSLGGSVVFGEGCTEVVHPGWWATSATTVDQTAVTKAITAASGTGATVKLPRYVRLSGAINLTAITDVTIAGSGTNNSSVIVGGNYNAFYLTGVCSRIVMKDFWVGSFVSRASGYGIAVVTAGATASDAIFLENIVVQNIHSPLYWSNVDKSGWRDVHVVQSIASGVGGTPAYVVNCRSFKADRYIAYTDSVSNPFPYSCLVIDSDTDTIILHGCEVMFSSGHGFEFKNSLGGSSTGPRLVRATDCYAEYCLDGFNISDGRSIRIHGAHAAVNTNMGINITGGEDIQISHPFCALNTGHGIHVNGGTNVEIISPACTNNSQGANNTYDGVRIENNVTKVRVLGGRGGDFIYSTVAFPNRTRYGISIGAVGTDYIKVFGFEGTNCATGTVGNFSPGTNNIVLCETADLTNHNHDTRYTRLDEAEVVSYSWTFNAGIITAGEQGAFTYKNANFNFAATDQHCMVDSSGGSVTGTLPASAGVAVGKRYRLTKITTDGNNCVLAANGTDTINGVASVTITARWESIAVEYGGGGTWVRVDVNAGSHAHTFASLTSKPTTIAGYGITDAYTRTEVDNLIAALRQVSTGGNNGDVLTANGLNGYSWAPIST